MNKKQTIWIHPTSYTFRLDEPERMLETIWSERPGWGYLRRRDLWIRKEASVDEIRNAGFVPRVPVSEDGALTCPHCGMYICGIPGFLVKKHVAECGGLGNSRAKLEEEVIEDQRRKIHEANLLAEQLRIEKEMEEEARRERFDRIREDNLSRQRNKDRKARLKRETREELRRK
ncbi:MAG: hypothetical protein RDU20_01285 [Desulfomonilaceae bacterium]|nr:hypothetical protein [Desulfomonilaceae bacterium]